MRPVGGVLSSCDLMGALVQILTVFDLLLGAMGAKSELTQS
jgi:hypothetical protein